MKTLRLMMCLAAVVAGLGCGPTVCEPGEQDACSCTDGRMGAQTCDSDGFGFGRCVCTGTVQHQNTGGGGGSSCGDVPSGAPIVGCNCFPTSVAPGTTVTATGCSSCKATMLLCNPNLTGFCAGGGIPWANVCK